MRSITIKPSLHWPRGHQWEPESLGHASRDTTCLWTPGQETVHFWTLASHPENKKARFGWFPKSLQLRDATASVPIVCMGWERHEQFALSQNCLPQEGRDKLSASRELWGPSCLTWGRIFKMWTYLLYVGGGALISHSWNFWTYWWGQVSTWVRGIV